MSNEIMSRNPSVGTAVLWVVGYLGVILIYTTLDVAVWRKLSPSVSSWLNVASDAVCTGVFLLLLQRRHPVRWLDNITVSGLLLAVLCAAGFYLVLDMGLDPLLAKVFPGSEAQYQEAVQFLLQSLVPAFLRICVIAPIAEEILMRGVLLESLRGPCGAAAALAVSAVVFALIHFNMVQTLSALVCGLILGLLYLHTGSLFCCMLTHFGYNTVSYFVMLGKGAGTL